MNLNSSNPNVKKFLYDVYTDLKKEKFKFKIYKKHIPYDFLINGYFCDKDKELVVLKDKEWLNTLAHEYCHFIQWKTHDPSFYEYYKYEYDPILEVENWLIKSGKSSRKIKKCFQIIKNNEYNCEKMTVKIIKKYGLPIDVEKYIQRSNLHILFYHCAEIERRWTKNSPQIADWKTNSKFLEKLPKTFKKNWTTNPNSKIVDELLKQF